MKRLLLAGITLVGLVSCNTGQLPDRAEIQYPLADPDYIASGERAHLASGVVYWMRTYPQVSWRIITGGGEIHEYEQSLPGAETHHDFYYQAPQVSGEPIKVTLEVSLPAFPNQKKTVDLTVTPPLVFTGLEIRANGNVVQDGQEVTVTPEQKVKLSARLLGQWAFDPAWVMWSKPEVHMSGYGTVWATYADEPEVTFDATVDPGSYVKYTATNWYDKVTTREVTVKLVSP